MHKLRHAVVMQLFSITILLNSLALGNSEENVATIQCETIDLSGEWRVSDFAPGEGVEKKVFSPDFDKRNFIPAQVPGTVRQALFEAGKIPDPYFGFNNEEALWVEEREWWFCRDFKIDNSEKGKFIDISFEGTVFKGEVWLNGKFLGELEGMFNPRSFPVSDFLNFNGKNHLAVRLEAPEDAKNIEKWNGLTFDSRREQLYSIAQCLFAWDWAPHMVPVGIWQPVKLRITGPIRAEKPHIVTTLKSENHAQISISAEIINLSNQEKSFKLQGVIRGKNFSGEDISFEKSGTISANETVLVSQEIDIPNAKLWWPNGMGEPNLYLAELKLLADNSVSDQTTAQFGIRTLKMVANDDIDSFIEEMGKAIGNVYRMGKVIGSYPWTFEINGVRIFAKGANWIPADQMLRLGKDRYEHLLRLARNAHFNVLRIWGGGLYETDDFYDQCDENGILAWQEFLSNRNFSHIDRENFWEGAEATILRIRNHPSLAFYCGGNEFDPDDAGSKAIVDSLENLIKKLDSEREFHRASPYMGDDHHWGVWHGKEPYTSYREVRPFRSEAGVNTFPVLENYLKFTPKQLLWPLDKTYIEYHGENQTRFQHLEKLERYADEFGKSESIEEFIKKSQLYQGLANGFNMEFCRANKFKNSGLLYWQYNDSWPCISWSLIDWYGTPKPGYYFVKRASRPLHIGVDFEKYLWSVGENFVADLFVLNDWNHPVSNLQIKSKIFAVDGALLADFQKSFSVKANASERAGQISLQIPDFFAERTFFVTAVLQQEDGTRISEAIYPIAVSKTPVQDANSADEKVYHNIFAEMKKMPVVKIDLHEDGIFRNETQTTIRLTTQNPSEHLAFFVSLIPEDDRLLSKLYFSDNYFSILPGENKSIEITIFSKANQLMGDRISLKISGWNVADQKIAIKLKN